MLESFLETRDHWPAVEVPKDLFSYFMSKQLFKHPTEEFYIHDRGDFLKVLDTDPHFRLFWEYVRQMYPQKSEYFASLVDEQKPFKPKGINQAYYRYNCMHEFNKTTAEERKKLQIEFEAIRPEAYQAALKGEARRLDCVVSEVRPECLVLPLGLDGSEKSRLADLKDALFLNIVSRLDTLDVFRISLVLRCNVLDDYIYVG